MRLEVRYDSVDESKRNRIIEQVAELSRPVCREGEELQDWSKELQLLSEEGGGLERVEVGSEWMCSASVQSQPEPTDWPSLAGLRTTLGETRPVWGKS